jgi:hypothetical protein
VCCLKEMLSYHNSEAGSSISHVDGVLLKQWSRNRACLSVGSYRLLICEVVREMIADKCGLRTWYLVRPCVISLLLCALTVEFLLQKKQGTPIVLPKSRHSYWFHVKVGKVNICSTGEGVLWILYNLKWCYQAHLWKKYTEKCDKINNLSIYPVL